MKSLFLAAASAASAVLVAMPVHAEDEFEGVYASATVGYDFQGSDGDEFISFDRGSNGSFGETVTTATGADAFSSSARSSRQDMVWSGFSTRWYGQLMMDAEIIKGFVLSLKIAFMSATAAVVLGTFAAFVLDRYKRFRGRTLFVGMANAPLVMPEVIIGLSLLLMMVSVQKMFGFPERGMATIWVGHTLLGMAYAAVVVQSRLREMPKELSEAAMNLGCRPHQVFFLVTLPNITQALASAWLLSFTLSLDDVVVASFVTGPGASRDVPITIYGPRGLNDTIDDLEPLEQHLLPMLRRLDHHGRTELLGACVQDGVDPDGERVPLAVRRGVAVADLEQLGPHGLLEVGAGRRERGCRRELTPRRKA